MIVTKMFCRSNLPQSTGRQFHFRGKFSQPYSKLIRNNVMPTEIAQSHCKDSVTRRQTRYVPAWRRLSLRCNLASSCILPTEPLSGQHDSMDETHSHSLSTPKHCKTSDSHTLSPRHKHDHALLRPLNHRHSRCVRLLQRNVRRQHTSNVRRSKGNNARSDFGQFLAQCRPRLHTIRYLSCML